MAVQADVGDVADIDRMVSAVVDGFGHLDVIVNNAGVTRGAYIMNLTEEDWDRMHRVNAKGVFFCLQRAAREMIPRREGRIINIASIAGRGFPGTSNAAYAASKGAVISLTKTAAQQLARHNLERQRDLPRRHDDGDGDAARHPAGGEGGHPRRRGEGGGGQADPAPAGQRPADIAAMAVFLASPGARNITGQCYNVDGGLVTS